MEKNTYLICEEGAYSKLESDEIHHLSIGQDY